MQWKKLIRDKARKEPGFKKSNLQNSSGKIVARCFWFVNFRMIVYLCFALGHNHSLWKSPKSTKNRKNLIFQIYEKKLANFVFVLIFLRRPISRLFIGQFQARNLKTCFEILSSAEFLWITIQNECRGKSSFSFLTNYFVGPLLYLIRPWSNLFVI